MFLLNVDEITAIIEGDLGEVYYAGKRILGYGTNFVLRYLNNAIGYR